MIKWKWIWRLLVTWCDNYETGGLTVSWGFFKKDMETEILGSEFELTFKSVIGIAYKMFMILFFILVVVVEIFK